jgi:hypothetical protein
MEVPKFVGAEAMEGGEIVSIQQVIDGGRSGPGPAELWGQSVLWQLQVGAIGLAVVAPLGVRLEVECSDPVGCVFVGQSVLES